MSERYFAEVPIYRISSDEFTARYSQDLAKHERSLLAETPLLSSEMLDVLRLDFWQRYGGPWQYNQVVGWLRLSVLGSQVRGDLWMSSRKKLDRRAVRDFRRMPGDYFCIDISPRMDSSEIGAAIACGLDVVPTDVVVSRAA